MEKIFELALPDRPREKLMRLGPKALADYELLAILLGADNNSEDVISFARKLVTRIDVLGQTISVEKLESMPGLGNSKSSQIVAALEFVRRRISTEGTKIRHPQDVLALISHLADRPQETFICISLNGANEVISSRIITIGLVNVCQVHPREVFADAITDRACSVIVAHNHPSGSLEPSTEDRKVTERLKQAAKLLGIKFLDHIIFSKRGFYSFSDMEVSSCD